MKSKEKQSKYMKINIFKLESFLVMKVNYKLNAEKR